MRIARFNTGTIFSSWSNLAIASTLRSMGHEVLEGVIATNEHGAVMHHLGPHQYRQAIARMPTIEQLQTCDAIFVSGPEYIAAWLHTLYGKEAWTKLKAVKAGFYLESTRREDHPFRFDIFNEWYDLHFFPDPLDAERYHGFHVQTCVDIKMFRPCDHDPASDAHSGSDACGEPCKAARAQAKKYDAAFVGSLYTRRVQFLARLLPLIPEIDFRAGGVAVRDIAGECQREWAQLLVRNLRQIRIHVGLPSNNTNITTARPYETLATGTFLLTYKTSDSLIRDGEHCRMYDPEKPEELADLIRYYLVHEQEREAIAQSGMEEIRRNYSNEKRLTEILAFAGLTGPKQPDGILATHV